MTHFNGHHHRKSCSFYVSFEKKSIYMYYTKTFYIGIIKKIAMWHHDCNLPLTKNTYYLNRR